MRRTGWLCLVFVYSSLALAEEPAPQQDSCCPAPTEETQKADKAQDPPVRALVEVARKPFDPEEKAQARASEWTEPDKRVPFDFEFTVTDHEGHSRKLSDFRGRPIAMTFIFTRCPNPNMCPLMTATIGELEKRLAEEELSDKLHLLMVSYDPHHDTPEKLKEYATNLGVKFTSVTLLRPDKETFTDFAAEFQMGVGYSSTGQIQHRIEMLIIDAQGRFVRDYVGEVWSNDPVLADLKRLLEEAAPPAAQE